MGLILFWPIQAPGMLGRKYDMVGNWQQLKRQLAATGVMRVSYPFVPQVQKWDDQRDEGTFPGKI